MKEIQNLLNTDELINAIEESKTDAFIVRKKHHHRKKREFYILWGIVIFAVLHLLLFSLPLMVGIHKTVDITGSARVIGIPYIEGNVAERPGQVIVLGRYDTDQISTGDHIIVYGLVNTTYYWEVEIVSIDQNNQTFNATYDGLFDATYSYDDIYGIYTRDANAVGIFLYVLSTWRGLIASFAVYASILIVYYSMVYKEMKVIVQRDGDDEQKERKEKK